MTLTTEPAFGNDSADKTYLLDSAIVRAWVLDDDFTIVGFSVAVPTPNEIELKPGGTLTIEMDFTLGSCGGDGSEPGGPLPDSDSYFLGLTGEGDAVDVDEAAPEAWMTSLQGFTVEDGEITYP